jgi:hypothetical protein
MSKITMTINITVEITVDDLEMIISYMIFESNICKGHLSFFTKESILKNLEDFIRDTGRLNLGRWYKGCEIDDDFAEYMETETNWQLRKLFPEFCCK